MKYLQKEKDVSAKLTKSNEKLQIHEYPFVRQRAEADSVFLPGMIVTLEPGLYDKDLGGVRLENDVLITEEGNEVITNSRIIRL